MNGQTSRSESARIDNSRRRLLKSIPFLGALGITSTPVTGKPVFPDTIPLPKGFQPEGIVTGRGHEFFVGSLADGAIYRGNLRTGTGDVLVPGSDGQVAVGLAHDDRSNHLFVAGNGTGTATVYNASNGEPVKTYTLTEPGSFINDVIVTTNAAFLSDSFRANLYQIPLGPAGRLPKQEDVKEIDLGGDFVHIHNTFNANGIESTPDEAHLILVNSSTGSLYTVDPISGTANQIDLDSNPLTAGDGILLNGKTLYVVRNQLNEIAVVHLDPDWSEGKVVDIITDENFDIPATIAEFGSHLYAVNARFGGPDDPTEAEYDVVRVSKGVNTSS